MLGELDAVRRYVVVRGDRDVEADRHVARRLAPDGLQSLDLRESRARRDRRLPGTPRHTGEEEEQAVDRGQAHARHAQRHALDDTADDEGGQRRTGHTARQDPSGEGDGGVARGRRCALGDRHTGDCAGPG